MWPPQMIRNITDDKILASLCRSSEIFGLDPERIKTLREARFDFSPNWPIEPWLFKRAQTKILVQSWGLRTLKISALARKRI